MKFKHISNYGDFLAIPFFALLIFYFYQLEDKNILEWVLFLFSVSGFVLDVFFTYLFFISKN